MNANICADPGLAQSAMSDPGDLAAWLAEVPADIGAIRRVSQEMVLWDQWGLLDDEDPLAWAGLLDGVARGTAGPAVTAATVAALPFPTRSPVTARPGTGRTPSTWGGLARGCSRPDRQLQRRAALRQGRHRRRPAVPDTVASYSPAWNGPHPVHVGWARAGMLTA